MNGHAGQSPAAIVVKCRDQRDFEVAIKTRISFKSGLRQ